MSDYINLGSCQPGVGGRGKLCIASGRMTRARGDLFVSLLLHRGGLNLDSGELKELGLARVNVYKKDRVISLLPLPEAGVADGS